MPIPTQADIELPLLLELERSGGNVQTRVDFPAFHERVAKHFPGITPEDKQLRLLSNQKVFLWHNAIEFARNVLREKGQVNGGVRGVWEITATGKQRLRADLRNLAIADVEGFIRSGRSIAQEASSRWRPQPSRQRARVSRRVREQAPEPPTPTPEERATQKAEAPTGPPPPTTPPASPLPVAPPPAIRNQLLERLLSLKPAQFEHLVARFLEAKGLVVLRSRGGPGDEGVDGECEHAFLKVKVAFQAKRYAPGNNVGIEPVQRLRGSMSSGFDRGVFITTSSFTPAARGWVEETRSPITLVDGNELVTEMVEMGLGIKEKPVVETQIDESFFESLG